MGITHCGYCGVASCCVCIINKAIMGPFNETILNKILNIDLLLITKSASINSILVNSEKFLGNAVTKTDLKGVAAY
jgi:hypothetical protein